MRDDSTPKLFGRYHDVLLLPLGFVLTTLVEGYLSRGPNTRRALGSTIWRKRLIRRIAHRIDEPKGIGVRFKSNGLNSSEAYIFETSGGLKADDKHSRAVRIRSARG